MSIGTPETKQLPGRPDVTAPDGSDVRILLSLGGGSMAHFSLDAGMTSKAVAHRTVEEIWYCVEGSGEMWRRNGDHEMTTALGIGTCVTIPVGTHFQFRAGADGLSAIAITMPPWPGENEAEFVAGPW